MILSAFNTLAVTLLFSSVAYIINRAINKHDNRLLAQRFKLISWVFSVPFRIAIWDWRNL